MVNWTIERSECLADTEDWEGKTCAGCGKKISKEELEKICENEELVLRNFDNYNVSGEEPRCETCLEEHFTQLDEFSGDNNPMHPNETAEEFMDHEDFESD